MNCCRNLSYVLSLVLTLFVASDSVFADYILPLRRIRDNGATAPPTYDAINVCCSIESVAESVAVSPDFKKVYGLANTLGFANYITVWDAATGQRFPAESLALNFPNNPPNTNNYIGMYAGPTQPLIRGNELFALSPVYAGTFIPPSNNWQIKRF